MSLVLWSLHITIESPSKQHSWQSLNPPASQGLREKYRYPIIDTVFENTSHSHSQFYSEETAVTIILNDGHQFFFLFYPRVTLYNPFHWPCTSHSFNSTRKTKIKQQKPHQKPRLLLSRGAKSQFTNSKYKVLKLLGVNL